MATGTHQPEILPSLLDRLIDDEPDNSEEPLSRRFQDIDELKQAVARDLEAMLNTRREALEELPAEFAEVNRSLLVYGLPDFTSLNLLGSQRDRLRRAIENTITTFEPRLERVRVTVENPKANDRALRFKVEGLLKIEPAPEPVAFDTVLHLTTQEYRVHEQG
jgi:type VI secretion system protein ImpF